MPFPHATRRWANTAGRTIFRIIDTERQPGSECETIVRSSAEHLLAAAHRLLAPSTALPPLISAEREKVAEMLYHGLALRYGFTEPLSTGNWTPLPGEAIEVNCYGQAIANYAIAQELGLAPMLLEFTGLLQEGSTQRAGHSFTMVNVGSDDAPRYWVVDQPMRMYGPVVKIGDNELVVENLAAQQERTYRRDFRKKFFGYLEVIWQDEERIMRQVDALRSRPEAVLRSGQRIAIAPLDGWQSERPLLAPWYLQHIGEGRFVSRIHLDRPGIKSRGLEFEVMYGAGGITKERVRGYYCNSMVWTDFTNPIPMVDLPLKGLEFLIDSLPVIQPARRWQFERKLMQESASPFPEQQDRLEAARQSYGQLQKSGYAALVNAFSIVEALYQHEKGERQHYLNPEERSAATRKLKREHYLFQFYATMLKRQDLVRRSARKGKPIGRRIMITQEIVDEQQLQEANVREFLSLASEQDRLDYILRHTPTYIEDAIDRLVFYNRRIQGKERKVHDLARDVFGEGYEAALFRGYTRIFAEFLGHIAMMFPELTLQEYKEKITGKLTSSP